MPSRKITLTSCEACPFRDHKGAFSAVSYKPVCRKAGRDLPFTRALSGELVVAQVTKTIPDWCPLPEDTP